MSNYTLKIGSAAPVDFATLGITGCTISQSTWARDSAQVTTSELIDTGDIIAPFTRCEIADLSGVVRFVGWLDAAPRRANASSETKTYTLNGPLRLLATRMYRPPGQTAGTLLNWDGSDVHRPIGTEAATICAAARAIGISISDPPLSGDPPTHHPQIKAPWQTSLNVTYLTALETIMRWAPAWALVADGGSLSWLDTLTSTTHPITALAADLSDVALTPHYDLLRHTVAITYLRRFGDTAWTQSDTWGPGGQAAALGSPFADDVLYELRSNEQWFPPGIAAEYARWVSKLQISCTVSAAALHWAVRPGHRVSFSGILSPWAGYDAVIQIVERDLFAETLQITTGPRRHLGLDQLFDLTRRPIAEVDPDPAPEEGDPLAPPDPTDPTDPTDPGGDPTDPGGDPGVDPGGDPGGGDPDEPPDPGTVTRTIQDPNSAAIPGAYFTVGGQSAGSGGSISLPPGSYTVSYWVPPDYKPPNNQSITLSAAGSNSSTETATFRDRLRLRRADGQDLQSVDINVNDLPTGDSPNPAKFQEYHVVINGQLRTAWFLSDEPKAPPAP